MENGSNERPAAWVFIDQAQVPERWKSRARLFAGIPLLPEEAGRLLEQGSTSALLTQTDEPFVQMVASGMAPDTIAKQSGLSLRTVHRRLAALREDLGVRSTPELVAHLARRGFGGNGTSMPSGDTGENEVVANQLDEEEYR